MRLRCCTLLSLCVCVSVYPPPPIIAMQWLGRNVTGVMNTHAAIEELLDALFPMWPMYQGK
jgi:hypothetical protein